MTRGGLGGLVVLLMLAAGTASCSSPTAPRSLTQDQAAVDAAQAAVAQDEAKLAPYSNLSSALAIACATQASGSGISALTAPADACPGSARENRIKANLKAEELKLQAAKDQVKSDQTR